MLKKINAILELAHENKMQDRKKKAIATTGTLRGAMAGALTPDGLYSAKCPRLDQARFVGNESTSTQAESIMFSAGFGHELFLEQTFKDSKIEFIREIPVSSTVEGVPWTGTPDFQIKVGEEWVGVEAKSFVSNFSVHKQISNGWPPMRHILQVLHYMTVLKRDRWLICVGHYFYAIADGEEHPPSIRWFEVTLNEDGTHTVENEKGDKTVVAIRRDDVLSYLKLIIKHSSEGTLAPRPVEKEISARPYNRCRYCKMESQCNAYDAGKSTMEKWTDKLTKGPKKK
jgi:hypothetical protein